VIATEVSLEQVIRQQVDPFGSPRIRLAGPVVTVPAFVVQPLALVIHELVVNAVAHGTRSTPNGNLSVQWENDPTHGGFTLRWEQVGG
jgi:two-component sensor histidine kinase